MLKNYIVWQLKKWWPLILVISLCTALPFIAMIQSTSLVVRTSTGEHSHFISSGEGLLTASFVVLSVFGMASTFVVPIFVFVYRTSIQAVDCFYQAGFDKRTIRRTRILIGLGIILAAFLVAYLLGIFILGMRYLATPEITETSTFVAKRLDLNFGYVILAGVFLMVVISAQYLINCFFASLGDSALVQILLMVCGFAATSLFVISPAVYVYGANSLVNGFPGFTIPYMAWGFGPLSFCSGFYELVCTHLVSNAEFGGYQWAHLAGLLISLALAAGAGVFLFLINEPSGEAAGHWKPRNVYIAIIPHVAALGIGILIAVTLGASNALLNLIGGYSLIFFYGAAYYAILSLMRKSFKPSKIDLILFLSVFFTVLVATLGMTGITAGASVKNY